MLVLLLSWQSYNDIIWFPRNHTVIIQKISKNKTVWFLFFIENEKNFLDIIQVRIWHIKYWLVPQILVKCIHRTYLIIKSHLQPAFDSLCALKEKRSVSNVFRKKIEVKWKFFTCLLYKWIFIIKILLQSMSKTSLSWWTYSFIRCPTLQLILYVRIFWRITMRCRGII